MLRAFLILSVIILAFSGCKEKGSPSVNPISQYGDALINSYERAGEVKGEADIGAVKRALAAYYAQNGKYPESLGEIEDFSGIKIPSGKYDYNPQTGEVSQR